MTQRNQRRGLRPLSRLALLGLLLVPLAACDTEEILTVEDPEFPTETGIQDPEFLDAVIAGAIRDFQVGYAGPTPVNDDAFVSIVGAFTDELYSSGSFTTRTRLDRRDLFPTQQGNATDETYIGLQQARRSLKVAAERAQEAGRPAESVALLRALEGYTYVALAEGWCSGIPFSEVEGGSFVPGAPISTDAVYDSAIVRFDQAIALAPDLGVAKVGKARALLNLGRFQDAAQAVSGVQTAYVYDLERSSNTTEQYNELFNLIDIGRYSVANDEGGEGPPFGPDGPNGPTLAPPLQYDSNLADDDGEGLSFLLARDPRVPWSGPVPGFTSTLPKYVPLRYTSYDTDIPLASGIEARLIEAEAALAAGNVAQWLETLNALRANVGVLMAALVPDAPTDVFDTTLQPLTDPGAGARLDLQYRERAFWLYLTGTRLGDFRRLVRVYDRAPNTVYPEGSYFKGGTYGEDKSFPIPFAEANNPEFNINECNTEQA